MSVMDLSSVIMSLGSHAAVTVKRAGVGAYTNGRYVNPAPATLSVLASIQPAGGEDLQVLPEGERTIDTIVIYTIVALEATSQANTELGDLVTYNARDYKVRNVENWGPNGAYFKSLATRVGQ